MAECILYLHNSSEISGGERSLLGLWAVLDRARYRPVLVLPYAGRLSAEAVKLGVAVHYLNVPAWRLTAVPELFNAGWELVSIVRKEKARVIHSYSPRNNVLAVLAGRACGIRIIWHERNIPVNGERDISAIFQSWPDAFICNSRAVARRFNASPKVNVILNGVDAVHFEQQIDKQEARRALGLASRKVVGVISNLSPRKGLDVFLCVAALIARDDHRVSFLVVGGVYGAGSSGQDVLLKAKADALGLSGKLVWAGFNDDVRPYLAAIDVLCHPTEEEACSRAILEAMASAKGIVAFDDGGNPELLRNGETGLLVKPGCMDKMAEAVRFLLKEDDCRERFGMCARQKVLKEFTLGCNGEKTMEVYQSLCV